VPQAILAAFGKAYPKAEKIAYSMEVEHGQKIYEMAFAITGKKIEAAYSQQGKKWHPSFIVFCGLVYCCSLC
jgi:hypothetical protein